MKLAMEPAGLLGPPAWDLCITLTDPWSMSTSYLLMLDKLV